MRVGKRCWHVSTCGSQAALMPLADSVLVWSWPCSMCCQPTPTLRVHIHIHIHQTSASICIDRMNYKAAAFFITITHPYVTYGLCLAATA